MPSQLFPERIETDRLVLERMTTETVDALAFYRLCSGLEAAEEVTAHLRWDPHETPKETVEFLETVTEKREADEGSEYLVVPKADERGTDGDPGRGVLTDAVGTTDTGRTPAEREVAGATGISVDWDRRTATLGMWLRKPFWGRGYSGERAEAMFELAFERLDLEAVVVEHHAGNEQSRRAIERYVERFGGGHDGLLRNWATEDGEPVDSHRYSVTAAQYREATA